MKKNTPLVKYIFMPFMAATIMLSLCSCKKEENRPADPVIKPDIVFYGLSASGQLSKYNAMSAENAMATVSISGLQSGESIIAIDFRPATGELYGLGSSSRLYIINPKTGNTRMVGADAFTPALSGMVAGFDFNPTVDRIRLVTNTGQNLRLNPETGTVAAIDGNINGASASVSGVAYTNSIAGAASTTLFDIDPATKKLYKQVPPNNGTLAEVGNLGVMAEGEGGFDISPDNSVALASLYVSGKSSLYRVDTLTGAAIKLGDFQVLMR